MRNQACGLVVVGRSGILPRAILCLALHHVSPCRSHLLVLGGPFSLYPHVRQGRHLEFPHFLSLSEGRSLLLFLFILFF